MINSFSPEVLSFIESYGHEVKAPDGKTYLEIPFLFRPIPPAENVVITAGTITLPQAEVLTRLEFESLPLPQQDVINHPGGVC